MTESKADFSCEELAGLAALLKAMAQLKGDQKSIFVEEKTTVLYSNPSKSKTWTFEQDGKYVDAPTRTIEGRIIELRYRKYDESDIRWFLTVTNGFEKVIVQSTHGRIFANSMLCALAQLSLEQLRGTVRVSCNEWEADKGTAHFCNISAEGVRIDAPRVSSQNIAPIAVMAQELVAEANGYTYEKNGHAQS